MAQGWSKHYFFCNDHVIFDNINEKVRRLIEDYYFRATRLIYEKDKSLNTQLLGVSEITIDTKHSFSWKDAM